MKLSIAPALAILALLGLGSAASAQTVMIRVLNGESLQPTFGALAYLDEVGGQTVKNALTDERGRALFVGIPPGSYRVRVEMIGMATAQTGVFSVADGSTFTEELRLESSAIQLEGIEVEADAGRCQVRPGGEGLVVAQVWDEARKALSAASFTDQRGAYRYETVRYDRRLDRSGVVLDEEQARRDGYMKTPFESRPAEDLQEHGYVQRDGPDYLYYAPDATVLLSDPFLDTHCFRLSGRNEEGLVGLRFEPTGDDKSVADISGTMWLDGETAELRWLDFEYQYMEPEMTSAQVGGRVDFERMPDGTWIVPEWWIRMPVMGMQTDFQGQSLPYIAQYHQTGGLVLDVREAGGRSLGQRAETGGIEGVVMDSVGVPLRAVRVGVVGSNQEVFTNGDGEFSITGLTAGRYQVRFVESSLEDLGYIPEPVERDVIRGEMSRLEYHMPSIGDVMFEECRGQERSQSSVVLMGTVVDPRGRPVPGATVRVQWVGFTAAGGGDLELNRMQRVDQTTNGFEMTAGSGGGFSFCEIPAEEPITLYAVHGEERSEEVKLQIADTEVGAMRILVLQGR